jgi:hypothetical protein
MCVKVWKGAYVSFDISCNSNQFKNNYLDYTPTELFRHFEKRSKGTKIW